MHIGLIGGIGPAATIYYYEQIVRAFNDTDVRLDLTIAHTSALTLSRNVARGLADVQAAEFLRVARQLAQAGAETVVITSMGGHFCAREFAEISPLPMINGPEAVARSLRTLGFERVGVLGTRLVMQTGLYGALAGLSAVSPAGHDLTQVNDDYVAMAIAGRASPEQRDRLLEAGNRLVHQQGAEMVLLGGTDLNLVFADAEVDYPVMDSAKVHVQAVVECALSRP